MPTIITNLILALAMTIILEGMIILPSFRSHCKSFNKLLINFVLINCITNLSLNTLLLFVGKQHTTILIILELCIPLIEAYLFRFVGTTRNKKFTIIICYIANAFSFIIGTNLLSINQ